MHMGSDGYVWAKAWGDKAKVGNGLEIEKHWYNFMTWGRCSYDAYSLGPAFWVDELTSRFPELAKAPGAGTYSA
jgi:hypothetical protein